MCPGAETPPGFWLWTERGPSGHALPYCACSVTINPCCRAYPFIFMNMFLLQTPAELNISAFPPVLRDWVIKGLGMSSLVYATGHIKDPVPLIEKRRGLSPGGRFPPSFIHLY